MIRKTRWWRPVLLAAAFFPGMAAGQEVAGGDFPTQETAVVGQPEAVPFRTAEADTSFASPGTVPDDTLRMAMPPALPSLRADGTVAFFPTRYYGSRWGLWNLHEGFNASLDMSVSASFGRNRIPGVGFGTGISAMYVRSLTDRLVLAAGGFYDRLSWNAFNENRFGINLLAGYRLTDRVSLYAYASKAFVPSGGHFVPPLPWLDNFGSRFGGMVHFKVSDAVSFSISVEEAGRKH